MFHNMNEFRAYKLFSRLFVYGCVCSLGLSTIEVRKMKLEGIVDSSGNISIDILDGKMLDAVLDHFNRTKYPDNSPYYKLYWVLKESLLYEGNGPIAPCFDEFDRNVEYNRGHWYAVSDANLKEMKECFGRILDR